MQITVTVLFYSNQILKRLNRGNANTLHTSMNIFSTPNFTEYTRTVPRCQKISVVRYLIYYLAYLAHSKYNFKQEFVHLVCLLVSNSLKVLQLLLG